MDSQTPIPNGTTQDFSDLKWCVKNRCLEARVLVSALNGMGCTCLWAVRLQSEGTGFGLFVREDADTVAAFCNLMAKRTGPGNWIGAFEVEEVANGK